MVPTLPGRRTRKAYSVSVAKAERLPRTGFERFEEANPILGVSKKDLDKAELPKRKQRQARAADRPASS